MAITQDKHGKASKARRNYRTNGENRGGSPDTAASTKYMRSGGPRRMAERKARNHGCNRPMLHGKPADQAHAHERGPITIIVPRTAIAAEPFTA